MDRRRPRVDLFLSPEPLATSVMLALDLFSLAARLGGTPTFSEGTFDRGAVRLVSLDGGSVELASGVTIPRSAAFDPHDRPDLLILTAFAAPPEAVVATHGEVVAWARALHAEGTILVGEGSGAYLLAATGLLDGREASVLWLFREHFGSLFPATKPVRRSIASADGRTFTTCGLDAGCDLGLALIARLYDASVADQAAQLIVRQPASEDMANTLTLRGRRHHGDATILAVQRDIEANLFDELSLSLLARRHGMSARTLTRRFRSATGDSPMRHVQRLRIEAAKVLLSDPGCTVTQAAYGVGYADSGSFSRAFKQITGESPRDFRRRRWWRR